MKKIMVLILIVAFCGGCQNYSDDNKADNIKYYIFFNQMCNLFS